jgi:hypothetical protein
MDRWRCSLDLLIQKDIKTKVFKKDLLDYITEFF